MSLMKKYATRFTTISFLICLLALSACGCETAKGAARDVQKADEWIRDNIW